MGLDLLVPLAHLRGLGRRALACGLVAGASDLLELLAVARQVAALWRRRRARPYGAAHTGQSIGPLGLRMVTVALQPRLQLREGGSVRGRVEVALELNMAQQQLVVELGDELVGGGQVTGLLERENPAVQGGITHAERAGQGVLLVASAALGHDVDPGRGRLRGTRDQDQGGQRDRPCEWHQPLGLLRFPLHAGTLGGF